MFRLAVCLVLGFVIISVKMSVLLSMATGAALAGAYLWFMSWCIHNKWFDRYEENK